MIFCWQAFVDTMASLVVLQSLLLVVFFAIPIIFGLLPWKFTSLLRSSSSQSGTTASILSFMNCFSGGVFLGTVFLHLLPEVVEGFEEMWEMRKKEVEFPVAYFIVMCGLFLVLFLESTILTIKRRRQRSKLNADIREINKSVENTNQYFFLYVIEYNI